MSEASQTDAQLLWEDVLYILRDRGLPAQTIAMLESLEPVELEGDELTVATRAGFVKRTVERIAPDVEKVMSEAAFSPMRLVVELASREGAPASAPFPAPNATAAPVVPFEAPAAPEVPAAPAPAPEPGTACSIDGRNTSMTAEQYRAWLASRRQGSGMDAYATSPSFSAAPKANEAAGKENPLVDDITPNDAKLTFDTFVEGNENRFALQAAKQVANGMSGQYNPLFIHGGSGLGKTHLLKAIQNYIALNDPERVCVYRVANDFVDDYVGAMTDGDSTVKEALAANYRNVDILIIDDIQNLKDRVQSIEFFFNTFNHLISHGKQIVIAADVNPSALGMDERLSSRIASGFEVSVQTPEYEFKRVLVRTFYDRMKEEGLAEYAGELTQDDLTYMAGKAGGNIRSIKAFCQGCLMHATEAQRRGLVFGHNEIAAIAKERWPVEGRIVTIEEIQQVVEKGYGIAHADLIGNKRSKEFMEPRHVAIWMSRELTDNTLAEIGDHFGGRSHGTIKHSIAWVDERREDRLFYDRMVRLKERLEE